VSRVIDVAKRMRPHVVDPWAFGLIVVAFALGVFLVSWNSVSLRLDVEGTNLAWVVLVAFGMTYHGDWGGAWRTGGGMVVGAIGAMAGLFGAMHRLPVDAMWMGAGLAVTAAAVALIAHVIPRWFTFAGAAVGFGVGVAAARSFPFRPITPADDLFTLMLAVGVAIAMGTLGSMAMRAAIVSVGMRRTGDGGSVHLFPHRAHHDHEIKRSASGTRAAR
jgi:hypothetical protein